MALLLNLAGGLLAGLMVVYRFRNRVSTAAFVGPLVAGTVCFVLMVSWFAIETRAITLARGEPPCGAFGAMVVIGTLGGAFVDFAIVMMTVGVLAVVRRLSHRFGSGRRS